MALSDTMFVLRPWIDLDNHPDYKDITDRVEKMDKYFSQNKEGIVALDFEGLVPFENIFSGGANHERVIINNYVTNDQGKTFFDREVQNGFKEWDAVWVYKMGLSKPSFDLYYFTEIQRQDTYRARILRPILNLPPIIPLY